MDILINVVGQQLKTVTNLKSVVSGTQKFIKFKFSFNADWDGLTKYCQFVQNGTAYAEVLDVNNSTYLPSQIGPGNCTIALYGTDGNDVRATTDYLNLSITQDMIVEDAQHIEMTESVLSMIVDAVSGHTLTAEQIRAIISDDVERVIDEYREEGILADLTIEDGTIGREKVDADFEATLAKADSAIQSGDVGSVTYEMLSSGVQEKLDTIDHIDLTIPDGSISRVKVDPSFEATLVKADTAIQSGDANSITRSMVDSSLEATLYRADHAMTGIDAGSISRSMLDQNLEQTLVKADNAMQSIGDGTISRSKVDSSFEATLDLADSAVQSQVVSESLPVVGVENVDYYIANERGVYEHYRWIDDDYSMIGSSSSTQIVNSLPNTGYEDIDYILNNNGEYQYYKWINNDWRLISGGTGAEVAVLNFSIDYFQHGDPASNDFVASADYLDKHYLDIDTLRVYTVEEENETYSWTYTALITTLDDNKDYYFQFGAGGNLLHFKYVVNKFIMIGTVAYSKDEIDTMMNVVNGNVSNLSSTVSQLQTIVNNINNMVKDVTINASKTQLTITYMDNSTSTITLDTGIDIDSTAYNVNDDNMLHFYDSAGNELENLRVTITGAGGGGGTSGGTASIGRVTGANVQCVYGDSCEIQYVVIASDAAGDPVGDGVGTLYINNVSVLNGFTVYTDADEGALNTLDISDYLTVGTNAVKIAVAVDVGNETNYVATKTWTVNAINMYFTWEYSDSQINTSAVTDYFTPYGALNKTIYTFIDVEPIGFNPQIVTALPDTTDPEFDPEEVAGINYFVHSGNSYSHYVWDDINDEFVAGVGYLFNASSTTRSGVQQSLSIPMQSHGSHAVVRYMVGDVNGEEIKTAQQAHDMVFVVTGQTAPIIATSFNTGTMTQYNTVQIPIVVYNPSATTTTVQLYEDSTLVSTWTNVDRTVHYWNYSPTTHGDKGLRITCGTTTKTITIHVEELSIDESEVTGYDFRFKASEFATNSAVQAWNAQYTPVGESEPQDISLTFSNNFDWVNGGLHTEYDEDNHLRQYFCVRAGTTMTINYDLFGQDYDPKQYGKNFKFIFKAVNCRTYDANVLTCMDNGEGNNGVGLVMTANEATLTTANESVKTYYCKDSYIEFETNIHPTSEYRYLQFWMDGSPDVNKIYDANDGMQQINPVGITIGSPNCDVYVYMIKAYPVYMSNNNELSNFIMDAPNAYQMVDRYNRNDVLNESGEIDYQKLATANPDLHVLLLDLNRMSTGKKDNTVAYTARHIYNTGGESHCFTVNNACVTIQGTSSVGYLESAGNVDVNFKYNRTFTSDNVSYTTGQISFDDGTTSTSGYSMTNNSIAVDYMNVKLNVASSENANNACIADWYNTYQPWLSPARKKNSKARDTMEFVPGAVFIRDRSGDLFGDTSGYHFYGICDIGNSKKNTKVFHDTNNPIACCVEVSNNTSLPCLMADLDYTWDEDAAVIIEAGETQKVFEFRYVNEDTMPQAISAWDRFVKFMYDNNPNLATNEPITSTTFGPYTFRGSGSYDVSNYNSSDYSVVYLYGYGLPTEYNNGIYDAATYITDTTEGATCYYYINYSNNYIYSSDGTDWTAIESLTWAADQNNVLRGTTISTYAGTYTTDSFEYRMANILQHCEEYMIIDPVVYHFVFIESNLQTDNVAKNTFWSSDDLVHWELSKGYDMDTALGNDNLGGLSFTYGLETDDIINNSYVFNAHDAAWITFIRGLFDAAQVMYRNRESAGCFNTTNFLNKLNAYQATRPERVWVADAQRKYLRPYEDNGTTTYIPMLAGRKTHQREQVKTYNGYYYASKYVSDFCTSQNIMVRGNTPTSGTSITVVPPANTATLSMYIDCYIVVASTSYNVVAKTKARRGQTYVMDFSTIGSMGETELYFCTAPMITELSGLAHLYFKQNNFGMATNLQRLEIGSPIVGYENPNLESLTIGNSRMLEYLDVRNCPNVTGALDLSGCVSLAEVYLENTSFTGITFATGGLLETAHLPSPTSITMRELVYLDDLSLAGTNNITTLRIEDCEFDPTAELTIGQTTTTQATKDIILNLVDSSTNLSRVRFTGIDWIVPGTTTLNRLLTMGGINDDSFDISQSVLTGAVYINGTSRIREINNYHTAWQYLDVTYNPAYVVEQYVATYVNDDGTQLCQVYVDRGTLPPDPVATGIIETPTKTSTAQYTFTFDGWEDIQSIMTGNRTIVAQYASSVRTYTVTWYSRAAVPLATAQAEYGTEVVYPNDPPIRTDDEDSLRYYVFMGWDKSTGYITGNTDVYAVWDDKFLPVAGSKDISQMSVAEIYGLGQAANRNVNPIDLTQYVDSKDYVDIVVGNDFNFSNVESELLCENRWFDGTNYLDTGIKLFDADSPSFTLAVDYEFYSTNNGVTLISCYDEDGDEGFRIRYNTNPTVQWGDKTATVGYGVNRTMCVIRHIKGSNRLFVYTSNLSNDRIDSNITSYELARTRNTSTDMTLIFGAIKIVAGQEIAYDLFASGWIYWAKIWYDDLGANNATELAQWPHETWRAHYYGEYGGSLVNRYRISNSVKYAKLPFILNNLLSLGCSVNTSGDNDGGWPNMTLPTVLYSRIYKALPCGWRSILKQVRVNSSSGHGQEEIVYSEDYVFIPSYTEIGNQQSSPYMSEGSFIEWFTNDYSRVKFRGLIIPENSALFTGNTDPSSLSGSVKQGDVWYTSNSGITRAYYYMPQSVASKHKSWQTDSSNVAAYDGGLWIHGDNWWTRSPSIQYNQYNVYVSDSGYAGWPGWVNTDYSLDICFAV